PFFFSGWLSMLLWASHCGGLMMDSYRPFSLPVGADTTVCCFSYSVRKLPQNHVKEYFYTSSKCPQPAVVFTTRKGRQVCANPDARWVKEYINFLELQ
uniref:C-C motif chemokine n=1 Tax=Meleagris gallopavo TaxID=9103 RepID=G1MSI4_MELGA